MVARQAGGPGCTCSSSPTLNSRRAALSLALFQSHHLSSFPVEERPEALLPQFRIEVGEQSVRSRHMRQGTASWEWRAQEDSRSFPQGRRRDRGATPLGPGTGSAPRSLHPRSAPRCHPEHSVCCSGRFSFPPFLCIVSGLGSLLLHFHLKARVHLLSGWRAHLFLRPQWRRAADSRVSE